MKPKHAAKLVVFLATFACAGLFIVKSRTEEAMLVLVAGLFILEYWSAP